MEAHAAGALHQRLDDDAGELVGVALQQARKRRALSSSLRQVDDVMLGQQAAEQRVHAAVGIADRHRAGGVAVIAAREGDEFLAPAHARG